MTQKTSAVGQGEIRDPSRNEQVRSGGGQNSSESVKCHEEENIKKTFEVEIRRKNPSSTSFVAMIDRVFVRADLVSVRDVNVR